MLLVLWKDQKNSQEFGCLHVGNQNGIAQKMVIMAVAEIHRVSRCEIWTRSRKKVGKKNPKSRLGEVLWISLLPLAPFRIKWQILCLLADYLSGWSVYFLNWAVAQHIKMLVVYSAGKISFLPESVLLTHKKESINKALHSGSLCQFMDWGHVKWIK